MSGDGGHSGFVVDKKWKISRLPIEINTVPNRTNMHVLWTNKWEKYIVNEHNPGFEQFIIV